MAAKKQNHKYIFVVGGVMSGVGKGIATASIGKILQGRGFAVSPVKIDPYVNVDAGTMNPTEHGEVFVLNDGWECDQDLGNYERFLDQDLTKLNTLTTGSIYLSVIQNERNLRYGGRCVEVVPHIPLAVIDQIDAAAKQQKAEISLIEIGGTVGEYQNVLFLEAVRMLKLRDPRNVVLALVSYLPYQGKDGELKTKPTQHAVRTLNAAGLQPDIIIARGAMSLDDKRKEKIAFNCNVSPECVISAPDIESIYDVPINFEKDSISNILCKRLDIKPRKRDLVEWRTFVEKTQKIKSGIKIGIIGKYFATGQFQLADSYISVIEAIKHAAYSLNKKAQIEWLNADDYDSASNPDWQKNLAKLKSYSGVVVPGGFGNRGVEGKISAIRFCRENKIPYFGLCYGMQLAVVEFARSRCDLAEANTAEVNPKSPHCVIDIMPEQKELMRQKQYGATMRLGNQEAHITKKTHAYEAYKNEQIFERHRHRYEVNPLYIKQLTETGLVFSGTSPDGVLMEIMELPKSVHPFFVGTQFHPELKSRPLRPHPLFVSFIKAAIKKTS